MSFFGSQKVLLRFSLLNSFNVVMQGFALNREHFDGKMKTCSAVFGLFVFHNNVCLWKYPSQKWNFPG